MLIEDRVGLLLLGTLIVLGLVLSVPILLAVRRRSRENAPGEPARRRYEQDRGPQRDRDPRDSREALARWRARPPIEDDDSPAATGGLAVPAVTFAVGILVGALGMALWAGWADQTEVGLAPLTDRPGQGSSTAPANGSAAVDEDSAQAVFAKAMRDRLPMEVGQSITLVNARAQGKLVILRFKVSNGVATAEVRLMQAAESLFRDIACARNVGGMRNLNDGGIEFSLRYADQSGRLLAEARFGRQYCAS